MLIGRDAIGVDDLRVFKAGIAGSGAGHIVADECEIDRAHFKAGVGAQRELVVAPRKWLRLNDELEEKAAVNFDLVVGFVPRADVRIKRDEWRRRTRGYVIRFSQIDSIWNSF